jgi:hypothetical protein
MDGTILSQGSFVASSVGLANPNPGNAEVGQANAAYIQIPSNADWMSVRNWTQSGVAGTSGAYFNGTANAYVGIEFFWQRGMPVGEGLVKYYSNAGAAINGDVILSGAFTLFDPSGQSGSYAAPVVGNAVATTATTNATRPVVSTASTAGLYVGAVVRLSNTAQTDVNGVDMVVSAVTVNTSFELLFASNALATAPGVIGGTGFYRIVNTQPLYYPRRRYVTNISQATNAVVSTSVQHGMTPGQEIRFSIPGVGAANASMVQLDGMSAIILSVVDDYSFVVNVNTSTFSAFVWPTAAQTPCSFPLMVPFGEDTATSLSTVAAQVPSVGGVQIFGTQSGILADATVNTGYLGMILGNGGNGNILTTPVLGPSGSISWSAGNVATGDLMYWVAGKSSYGGL